MVTDSLLLQQDLLAFLECYFTRVLYVHGVHKNLISVPTLIDKRLSLTMLKNKCLLESKRGLVVEVKKSSSFYDTECLAIVTDSSDPDILKKDERKVSFASVADTTNMWQNRFSLLGTKAICFSGCVLGSLTASPLDPTGATALNPT